MLFNVNALTIKDAATRLGVSPQRVSQMLTAGDLDGPHQPAGIRAPRGVPRVHVVSIEVWEAHRANPQARRTRLAAPTEARLRDDAHRLKVALDVARDQITRQRTQNERLSALLSDAVAVLRDEQALAREEARITEEYASIATNHLAPEVIPGGS